MAFLEQIDKSAAGNLNILEMPDDLKTWAGVELDGKIPASGHVRIIVHIVAAHQDERAVLARRVFSAGHHAEIYSDVSELIAHHPSDGVVLVDECGAGRVVGLMKNLLQEGIWLPVIGFGKQLDFEDVIAGIKAGVTDYLVVDEHNDILMKKLANAHFSGQMVRASRSRKAQARLLLKCLSPREREVIDLLSEGNSNKEMARILEISPRTVEIHRMKMMGKLRARTSAEAIRLKLEACQDI